MQGRLSRLKSDSAQCDFEASRPDFLVYSRLRGIKSASAHALGELPRWAPFDICQCLNSKWLTFTSIMANASENKGTFCKYVCMY